MGRILTLIPIIIEVASIVLVAEWLNGWLALVGIIAGFFLGGAVLKSVGGSLIAEVDAAARAGEPPNGALLRAACRMGAGILFICPGFASDLLAILLLLPASRTMMGAYVWRQFRRADRPAERFYRSRANRENRGEPWGENRHETGGPAPRSPFPAGPAPVIDGSFSHVSEPPAGADDAQPLPPEPAAGVSSAAAAVPPDSPDQAAPAGKKD